MSNLDWDLLIIVPAGFALILILSRKKMFNFYLVLPHFIESNETRPYRALYSLTFIYTFRWLFSLVGSRTASLFGPISSSMSKIGMPSMARPDHGYQFILPWKKHVANTVYFQLKNRSLLGNKDNSKVYKVTYAMDGAEVVPVTNQEQYLEGNEIGKWEWKATPKEAGLKKVIFNYAQKKSDGKIAEYGINSTITEWVIVPGNLKSDIWLFLIKEWKWIAGLFVASGMGWTIIKKLLFGI